jgi:hypothetical protein
LNHAGANGKIYSDLTGYMGASYAKTTSPQMCFNAQNHWQLAWYRKRAIEIDPSVSQTLRIAPFVHFGKIAQASVYVLVKAGNDLYFQVNQSEEFNRGTAQMKNQLVVVQEKNGSTDLLAGLDLTNQSYAIENFQGSGSRLVLQVCDVVEGDVEMPYHMVVSVGYTWSLCNSNDSSSFGSSTKKVQSFSTSTFDKADVTTFSVGKEKKESNAEVGDFVSSKVSEPSVFYGGSQTSFRVVGKNGD